MKYPPNHTEYIDDEPQDIIFLFSLMHIKDGRVLHSYQKEKVTREVFMKMKELENSYLQMILDLKL